MTDRQVLHIIPSVQFQSIVRNLQDMYDRSIMYRMKTIYAVGTGPGSPEYLTLQAVNTIKNADIIFAPDNNGKHLALDTVQEFVNAKKIIPLHFPMTKMTEEDYEKAAASILNETADGETGVILTIGDPMLYSTFIALMPYLQSETVNVKVVSGIPSYIAAAGLSLTPLATKGKKLCVTDSLNEQILSSVDSIALLKTSKNKKEDIEKLEAQGFDFVYVRRATMPDQAIMKASEKENILDESDYISLLLAHRKQK